ncbi:MAG: Ig-like domain-containing protein, partial [Sedimentisphaerales bacterium]|nr:Ig-like domain-containing protein [Sedimentisphaerales bacterium]
MDRWHRLDARLGHNHSYKRHGGLTGALIDSPGVWSFIVYAAAPKATTPGPANNATGVPLNQQLTFVRPSSAVKADVYLKTGTGAFVLIASQTTALTINPGALAGNTSYQWRVDTYNGANSITTGDIWLFSTLTSPTKATNPNPADGATSIALHPTLSWTRPASATSCDVWFGQTGAMTKVLSATTNTSYQPPALTGNTQYQWRIDTINAAGTTQGDVWGFTTIAPPDAPGSPNPVSGTVDVARNQDISWATAARATSYRVYFSTSQADVEVMNASAQQVPDITALSWDTGLMAVNTNYYWRIVAINEAGSAAGPVWTFRTGTPVMADPVIKNYKKRLCALANNRFWYSDNNTPVAMVSLIIDFGGGYALDTSKPCAMLEAFQKVYIINDGRYFVVDFCNVKLTATQAFDYSGNYVPERGSLLYGNTGGVILVDYVDKTAKIIYGFVTNGSFAVGNTVTGSDTSGRQTNFTVSAVTLPTIPHIYKWQPYPNRLSSTGNEYGIMPTHSSILRMYRGRAVLAGDKNAPHQWYMSGQANFYNWAYGSEDQGAPVAGTDTDIGKIGDIIRAVIPYSDDFCLLACSQTL